MTMSHGTLEQAIDGLVQSCELDPMKELGARVKLVLCELYERTPPGFQFFIEVRVKHELTCPRLLAAGECECKLSVDITFPGAGEPVTVH